MGETVRTLGMRIGAAVLAIGLVTASAAPADEIEQAIAAAIQDAGQGRCDDAFKRLAKQPGLENRAHLLAGQCKVRQGLYSEALGDLDGIAGDTSLSPTQTGDADLYRGVALYHLDRFSEAGAALDRADGKTTERGQLELYRGLIALRDGENDRAAPMLESAGRMAPTTTEPVASYYAGVAWLGNAERTKARAALNRVIDIDGNGPWGQEAAKLLESTELFPYYVRASVGFEYDDNVQLRGGVTQILPFGVRQDGEKDWRGVWRIDAGVQLFAVDDWSGGITGGYAGTAQDDLGEFDTHFPTVGAYVARRFDVNTTGQARYQYGFAWVDDDTFLRTHTFEMGVSHIWAEAGTTIVVADVLANDLRFQLEDVRDAQTGGVVGGPCTTTGPGQFVTGCGPQGLDEGHERDRDGYGIGAAIEHRYPLSIPDAVDGVFEGIELGGGYRFRYYNSQGEEWEHLAHILSAGIEFDFPFDIRLSTRASYEYRDFFNRSTFPDHEEVNTIYALASADREEHEVTFSAEIEKDLTEFLSVSARWSYLDNESNRRVYDYTRSVVGGYLNFRFD